MSSNELTPDSGYGQVGGEDALTPALLQREGQQTAAMQPDLRQRSRQGEGDLRGASLDPAMAETTSHPAVGGTAATQQVGDESRLWRGARQSEEGTRLDLIEERLEAHTSPVQIGEVLIRKQVVTETRTIEVPIRREELVVERRSFDRGARGERAESGDGQMAQASTPDEFERSFAARFQALGEGESIHLPLMQDEVVVQKRPVVYEEVLIGKRATSNVQQVSGTVRREELKVGRRGDVDVSNVRQVPVDSPKGSGSGI